MDDDLLKDYQEFVDEVSSDATKNIDDFGDSVDIIDEGGVEPTRLLTASIGLSGEVGEFNDIVKKCFFQGKEMDEDVVAHLKSELGDIMWYWVTACAALELDPFEVISENQEKLEARYGEKFEINRSEVRKEGDL